MKAVYKTGMGTVGCVCGDLGLGDMRGGMWGHQSWDARTYGTGTRGYIEESETAVLVFLLIETWSPKQGRVGSSHQNLFRITAFHFK